MDVFTNVLRYVKLEGFETSNTSNVVFKLFYKGAVGTFITASLVGAMTQYLGQPIQCDQSSGDKDFANQYCWVEGTFHVPKSYQNTLSGCSLHQSLIPDDKNPYTTNYQWVTIVLFLQGLSFLLPHLIWTLLEGGLIDAFGKEGKYAILTKNLNGEPANKALVVRYVESFVSTMGHNNPYFFKFVFCEILNFIVLILNFWFLERFFSYQFL